MQPFVRQRRIRFADCDSAGIVCYPQYLVMLNGLVEAWVGDGLGIAYHELLLGRRVGLPTVHLEADFRAVSRLACTGPGTDDARMRVRQSLVTRSLDTHRSIDIPPDLRAAIERTASEGP